MSDKVVSIQVFRDTLLANIGAVLRPTVLKWAMPIIHETSDIDSLCKAGFEQNADPRLCAFVILENFIVTAQELRGSTQYLSPTSAEETMFGEEELKNAFFQAVRDFGLYWSLYYENGKVEQRAYLSSTKRVLAALEGKFDAKNQ